MEGIGSTRREFRNMQMDAPTIFIVCILLSGCVSLLNVVGARAQHATNPMRCLNTPANGDACTSYLFIEADASRSVNEIAELYGVRNNKVFNPPSSRTIQPKFYLVEVDCFCHNYNSTLSAYVAGTSYMVDSNASNITSLADISEQIFDGMVFIPDNPPRLIPGKPIQIDLVCGCPVAGVNETLQQAIVTYIVQQRDTMNSIVNSLRADLQTTLLVNNFSNPDFITPGQNVFIPINFKPTNASFDGAPPTAPDGRSSQGKTMVGIIAGGVAGGVVLLIILVLVVILYRRRTQQHDCPERAAYNNVVTFGSTRSYLSSKSYEIGKSGPFRQSSTWSFIFGNCAVMGGQRGCSVNDNVKRNITLPREAMSVFDQEKPVVFMYDEIIGATQKFDVAKKLGQGTFGTVYRGTLRHQEVAVKQMKATKSKEFLAELKVLCKVHHTNLIELIGYSSGEDNLCLVYEFAENGSLSDHLHEPVSKGNVPLTWTARVQIAIDAARGLEYIHEHTKTHYIHRDVKTRNILLDSYYRAKLADFGLAKLVEQKDGSPDVLKTATLSGTFGYLAPEYVRDGLATSKSDVYAFGVVMFELITGREAVSSTKPGSSNESKTAGQRQSLISTMLRVLEPVPDDALMSKKFRSCMDPNLDGNYPFDAAYKMAQLGKACVDEDPALRPDMKNIVLALSQNLLTSIEWEAALAGSSQIFSGLVQGR